MYLFPLNFSEILRYDYYGDNNRSFLESRYDDGTI